MPMFDAIGSAPYFLFIYNYTAFFKFRRGIYLCQGGNPRTSCQVEVPKRFLQHSISIIGK